MSLLKQILSPFVEFDEDKKPGPPTVNRPAVKENTPPVTPQYRPSIEENAVHPLITGAGLNPDTSVSPLAQTVSPQSNLTAPLPEHRRYFEKLIDDANAKNPMFAGTDYKEFIDSKLDIDNITDEETRYRTAFNVLKRTGLTKEKLLTTAQEYHNIVGRDLNAFQSAHSQKYQKEVKEREQLIQRKAEELQALSEKINALKKEISQLAGEMTETKDKLNLTKNSFLLAGEHMQAEIQEELKKIQKYF